MHSTYNLLKLCQNLQSMISVSNDFDITLFLHNVKNESLRNRLMVSLDLIEMLRKKLTSHDFRNHVRAPYELLPFKLYHKTVDIKS